MKLLPSDELRRGADSNGHLSPIVLKILDGALDAIVSRGARRLSMSDIIDASGVSRGTLYRYFSSKEEVLTGVSEFVCKNFEDGIRAAGKGISDPLERFRAVMLFYSRFTHERAPDRIFEVEPGFHLEFFRTHFVRHKRAVQDALDPVFDFLDATLCEELDRDVLVEMLVRTQLSTLLVPASGPWFDFWCKIPDRLEDLVRKFAVHGKLALERM